MPLRVLESVDMSGIIRISYPLVGSGARGKMEPASSVAGRAPTEWHQPACAWDLRPQLQLTPTKNSRVPRAEALILNAYKPKL